MEKKNVYLSHFLTRESCHKKNYCLITRRNLLEVITSVGKNTLSFF